MKRYRGFEREISLSGLGFVRSPSINGGSTSLPGGFYAPYSPPTYSAPTGYVPTSYATRSTIPYIAPHPDVIPYYDPSAIYSRSEIVEMIAAAKARESEITDRQGRIDGDGIAEDLEQIAIEANATHAAIDAAGAGDGLPIKTGAAKPNLIPLALLGALAYFLF